MVSTKVISKRHLSVFCVSILSVFLVIFFWFFFAPSSSLEVSEEIILTLRFSILERPGVDGPSSSKYLIFL